MKKFVECIKDHVMASGEISHHKGVIYPRHDTFATDVYSTSNHNSYHGFVGQQYFDEYFVELNSLEDYGKPVVTKLQLGGTYKYDQVDNVIRCEISNLTFALTAKDLKNFNELIK